MIGSKSCKILIVDDQSEHAEAIQRHLLGVSTEEWIKAGAVEGFGLGKQDVVVFRSSAELVASLRQGDPCTYDTIICDINMDQKEDEGALAVYYALREAKLESGPCLLAMTQFINTSDYRRQEIEHLSKDPRESVPCLVIAKFKALPDVHDREFQLDLQDWRDLVLRAIVYRQDHKFLKKLSRDAILRADVEKLGPFKRAFKEAHEQRTKPVVILISEPFGLQATLAEAFGREVERVSVPGMRVSQVEKALFGGYMSLHRLTRDDALLVSDADDLVRDCVLSPQTVGQRLIMLNAGRIAVDADSEGGDVNFVGMLILCVTLQLDTEISARADRFATIYKAFPRIRLPAYKDVRREIAPLIELMLTIYELRADNLDRAVMAAYNWDLGYPFDTDNKGFTALWKFIDWTRNNADGLIVPDGTISNELTQSKDARESIYAHLNKEALLLYILERLARTYGQKATQSAAAFLYYLAICNFPAEDISQQQAALERFWKKDVGVFDMLCTRGDPRNPRIKPAMNKSKGDWPDRNMLRDSELYSAKPIKNENGPLDRSTSEKMLELLKTDFSNILKNSPEKPTSVQARIMQHFENLKGQGRSKGDQQLNVLDNSYFSTS